MHTVLLRTLCGCERKMHIQELTPNIDVPYKPRDFPPYTYDTYPEVNIKVKYRRFKFITKIYPEAGFSAVYEEIE